METAGRRKRKRKSRNTKNKKEEHSLEQHENTENVLDSDRNDSCANVEDAAAGALTIEESTADTNLTKKKRRSSRNEVESDMGSQSESHFEVTVTDIVDADHSKDTAIEMETDVKLHSDVTADREAGEQLSINNHIGMEDMDMTGDPKENSLLERTLEENTIVTDNFILSSTAKEFVTEILPETIEIKIEQQCPADQKCTSSLDHSDVITKTDSTDINHIIESDSAELKENDSLVKNKMNISSDDIVSNDTCVPTEYIDNESSLGTKDDIQQLEKKEQAQKQINLVQDDTPITLDIPQSINVHKVSDFNKVDGKSVGLFTHVNEKATLQKPITDSSEKSDEDLSSPETNLKLSVRKDEEKTDHSILDVSGPSVRISDGQGVSEKEKQEVFFNANILPEGETLVTKCEQQSIIPHEDTGLKNTNNSEVLLEKNTCDGSVLDNSTSNDVLVDSKLEVEEIRKNKESNLSHPLAASDKSDVNDKLDVPNSTQQRDVANISESESNISNLLQCTSNLKTQSEKSTDEQTDFKNQQEKEDDIVRECVSELKEAAGFSDLTDSQICEFEEDLPMPDMPAGSTGVSTSTVSASNVSSALSSQSKPDWSCSAACAGVSDNGQRMIKKIVTDLSSINRQLSDYRKDLEMAKASLNRPAHIPKI